MLLSKQIMKNPVLHGALSNNRVFTFFFSFVLINTKLAQNSASNNKNMKR